MLIERPRSLLHGPVRTAHWELRSPEKFRQNFCTFGQIGPLCWQIACCHVILQLKIWFEISRVDGVFTSGLQRGGGWCGLIRVQKEAIMCAGEAPPANCRSDSRRGGAVRLPPAPACLQRSHDCSHSLLIATQRLSQSDAINQSICTCKNGLQF